MQTLTAGSFLNLENAENVEALKFTAGRLAEMTTAVVKENLNGEALKNLANDLWQKAEYVARETDRRRLQEIFNENFCERFRQLKPEVGAAEILSVEVQTGVTAAANNFTSTAQTSNIATTEPQDGATEAEGKKDEFLGFVKSDEPFIESPVAENAAPENAAIPTAPEKIEQEKVQTAAEDEPVADKEISTQKTNGTHPQPTAASAADAKSNQQPAATSAVKTSAPSSKTAEAVKEPFEFGKCTVNLNLTLLPASGDGRGRRRAIVSAASHGSPPEIEFVEIAEGENLTEIAALVRGKLERFQQTLPAKYIEQLRSTKTKQAKKPATAAKTSTTVVAPTKAETASPNAKETSGEQKTQNSGDAETAKTRAENVATNQTAPAQPAIAAVIPQTIAANNVQPSLF